jgi:hypothetical protein
VPCLADWRPRGIVGVEPVVALGAQAAELAEPECGEIASVRLDMVGDGRRRDAACFQAEPTQRLDTQLMRPAALPASGAVPAMNVRRVRHRGSIPDKRAFVLTRPEFSRARLDTRGNPAMNT